MAHNSAKSSLVIMHPIITNRWTNRFWKPGRGQNGQLVARMLELARAIPEQWTWSPVRSAGLRQVVKALDQCELLDECFA